MRGLECTLPLKIAQFSSQGYQLPLQTCTYYRTRTFIISLITFEHRLVFLKVTKSKKKHDISGTGSLSVFRLKY